MAGPLATTWLLTYAAHSALLTALAAVFERTAWGAAPERRDAVWKLALAGAIASATVFVAIGSAPSGAEVRLPAVVMAPQGGAVPAIRWVTLIWIAVTAALALRAVRAWRTAVRGAGRRRAIRRGAARAALDAILGPDAGRVVLTCSRTLGVPVAFRREICVPVRALRELPHDELRALLAHEAAHVMRRDSAWLAVSALVRTLGWWQPLNFLAASRLRLAMELCCDERAAIGQPERDALARCLVRVAEWNVRDDGAALAAIAGGGPALRRRLSSLLDETPCAQRRRPRPWLAVAAVTVPAIWLAPMIAIADVAHLPAAAARLVPRALTAAASVSLPAAPVPSDRPARRKEKVQPAATRVDPLPAADAGEGSPHPEDAGPPVAAAVVPPTDPPATPSTLAAPTAYPSLRAAIAAARVAPAPPPDHRFDVPRDDQRVLPWIGVLRTAHSFDPYFPKIR